MPLDLVGFHLRPQKAAVDLIQQEHSIDSILSFLRLGFCCTLAPPGTNSFQTCFKHGFVALLSFGARHWLVSFTNAFGFKGREFGPWVRGGNEVLSLCRGRVRCAPDEKLVARCDTTFCRSCCHVISYVLRLVTKLNWFSFSIVPVSKTVPLNNTFNMTMRMAMGMTMTMTVTMTVMIMMMMMILMMILMMMIMMMMNFNIIVVIIFIVVIYCYYCYYCCRDHDGQFKQKYVVSRTRFDNPWKRCLRDEACKCFVIPDCKNQTMHFSKTEQNNGSNFPANLLTGLTSYKYIHIHVHQVPPHISLPIVMRRK